MAPSSQTHPRSRLLLRVAAWSGLVLGIRALARRRSAAVPTRRELASRMAWAGGRLRGLAYRWSGGHPSLLVDDLTLADRVRSTLGPLEKRLDVPHVHVMAEDHIVLLHGEVGTAAEAAAIEDAVVAMPGVAGVESYVHIGLTVGETRPSDGADWSAPSDALAALSDAARTGGAGAHASEAVRSVLVVLGNRLPDEEREHVAAHLPEDVQALLHGPRRTGERGRLRTAAELVSAVVDEATGVPSDRAEAIVEAVVGQLRHLVPDEAGDVAAVLPEDLRRLWLGAVPS